MALTSSEEKRVQAIEAALAQHATAIKNLAAKKQLAHLISLLQNDITLLRTAVESLQSQINATKK
jgi:hypothetical protein